MSEFRSKPDEIRAKILEDIYHNLECWRERYGMEPVKMRELVMIIGTGVFRELISYPDDALVRLFRNKTGRTSYAARQKWEQCLGGVEFLEGEID